MVMIRNNAGDTYDALGRRVEVVNFADVAAGGGARTYQYYYDGQRAVYEDVYTGLSAVPANHALALYTVFGNYIDEALVMVRGGADYYFGQDHLFSTVALYKIDSGDFALAERYEYDAYGKATVYTNMADWNTANPTTQSYSTVGNGYTFTGRRLDTLDDGGYSVMYYRARYYDTETGRFMQRDPLGINPAGGENNSFKVHGQYRDGVELFNYVGTNPIIFVDPMGLYMTPMPPNHRPEPKPSGSDIAQLIVDAFETDSGKFIDCMGACLGGKKVCPRFILMAIGSRVPKIGKGAVASTKTIWQLKVVRNITGTTIKGGMRLGRIGAVGIIIGGAYDSYRLVKCARQCAK